MLVLIIASIFGGLIASMGFGAPVDDRDLQRSVVAIIAGASVIVMVILAFLSLELIK